MSGRAGVAYRENKHVYLPKFDSAKSLPGKAAMLNVAAPAPTAPAGPAKLSVNVPSGQRTTARAGNWSARLNPLNPISRLCGPAAPAWPVTAVQTELSLDTVKVVHNDLRDAEVEVVPLKSRPARTVGATEPAAAWSELGTGFFEANAV